MTADRVADWLDQADQLAAHTCGCGQCATARRLAATLAAAHVRAADSLAAARITELEAEVVSLRRLLAARRRTRGAA